MNIKLSKSEAVSLIAPTLQDKFYPASVTVEIEEPAPAYPIYTPPPVQTRIPAVREAFTRNAAGYLNKIAMIKEVRTLTGWGLKDSKDFVEAILDGLRIT